MKQKILTIGKNTSYPKDRDNSRFGKSLDSMVTYVSIAAQALGGISLLYLGYKNARKAFKE